MNKKWITTALLVTTTAAALTGCGSSETAKPSDKPLIVGTEPSFPPFEMTENDTYVGFDIDLANAIGEKLGRKVEIKTMGFDALIPALKSGQIDLIASAMSATEERKKQVDFTDPYYIGGSVIVVRKDNTDIRGWDDITGKTVAVQAGSKPADFAEKQGALLKQFDANYQCLQELQVGASEAAALDKAVALYYISKGGLSDLKVVGEPKKLAGSAMAINKGNEKELKEINAALQAMKKDGTYTKLYQKWFGVEPTPEELQ
ncbi:basic amino acid ABC transporter substrate-binding protein [Megasphaera stantonii]|uniref:basic amino acid ABC transporter substrate-binding protein n=1 Tax=Megasphaera stantonii TaxID=2144175 RepID=UPI0029431031|nr:basic amino acid ABC transporter substrate-binding protein [Megasphaera stantonii]